MKKSTVIGSVIILIVLGLVVIGIFRLSGLIEKNEKTIDVTGTATIKEPSDRVILSVGVQTQAENANDAEQENTEISNNIYNSLEEIGLTSEDYKTESYNIYPNYNWENNGEITGYTVTHMISIDTDKVDLIGEILDNVVDAGANNIYGIDFTLKEETRDLARAEAYEMATNIARIKAESIASGLNVEITDIIKVSDTAIDFIPYRTDVAIAEVVSKGSNIEIEAGNVEVSASISVSYGFR